MLNYYSNHLKQMIRKIVIEYISAKIRITSPLFLEWTLAKLYRLLSNNDQPKWFIIRQIKTAILNTFTPELTTKLLDSTDTITLCKPMRRLKQIEEKTLIYNKILTTKLGHNQTRTLLIHNTTNLGTPQPCSL